MQLSEDILKNHRKLSQRQEEFVRQVTADPENLKRERYPGIDDKIGLAERVTIQPWPILVNATTREEMSRAAVSVLELVKSIPQRIFADDPAKIAAGMGLDERAVTFMLRGRNAIEHLVGRGDFIWTEQGLKCIEYNVAGNLGGWEGIRMEIFYRKSPIFSQFLAEKSTGAKYYNTLLLSFGHIVANTRARLGETDEINIGLAYPNAPRQQGDIHSQFFNGAYAKMLASLPFPVKGRLFLTDPSHFEEKSGRLYFGDCPVHAMLEFATTSTEAMVTCQEQGNLTIFNGPMTALFNNKLTLAILYQNKDSDLFDRRERELIERYIPWSCQVRPGRIQFRGETVDLENLATARRTSLILKTAEGHSAKGVFMGCNTPQDQWEETLKKALAEGNWMMQEFVESLPFYFLAGEICEPHILNWGLFAFGQKFGGGFARMMPTHHEGPVTRFKSASEAMVFEVDK